MNGAHNGFSFPGTKRLEEQANGARAGGSFCETDFISVSGTFEHPTE
jgi:hypothetical protein